MKSLTSIVFFVLLVLVGIQLLHSQSNSTRVRRKVDKGTILFLFQKQVFQSLTEKLEGWQQAFEEDYNYESNVFDAFEVFESVDPLYERLLNIWVQQHSTSYAPFIARAKYYYTCGWNARGHRWVSETSENQFKEMERYFSLALQDIATALQKNPKLDICYEMMIAMGMTVGDDRLMKNALQEALKYHPYAYRVRAQYLHTLTPRWGGSYLKMEEFIEQSEQYAVYNPELKALRAAIPQDKASMLKIEENYDEAIQKYNEAIQYSERASYYTDRGDCYYNLNDYRRALADYNQALDLSPNNTDYLRRKAGVLYKLKRFTDAQETIEMAARLDPNDKWIQKRKEFYESDGVKAYTHSYNAATLMEGQRYEEAIIELNEAIKTNPDEPVYYFNRGICYLQMQQYEKSLMDLRSATERKRDYVKAYDAIGWITYRIGKYDEALEAINTILTLEPNNAEAYYNRAMVYCKKDWISEAIRDARLACDMGYQQACILHDQIKR